VTRQDKRECKLTSRIKADDDRQKTTRRKTNQWLNQTREGGTKRRRGRACVAVGWPFGSREAARRRETRETGGAQESDSVSQRPNPHLFTPRPFSLPSIDCAPIHYLTNALTSTVADPKSDASILRPLLPGRYKTRGEARNTFILCSTFETPDSHMVQNSKPVHFSPPQQTACLCSYGNNIRHLLTGSTLASQHHHHHHHST
jgi:hypothetical protein